MNYSLIFKLIGNVLRIEALFMLFPLVVSLIAGGGDHPAFLWSILILAVVGTLLTILKPKDKNFRTRDAFVVAGLSWILFSIFGALPFYFSGYFKGFIDCVFESVSGFTTTGSTILTNIEILPKGILFWRSFTHWIGGMGVLMFVMAVIPSINASSVNILRAESTGPSPDKIVPKIRETARIMYLIYFVLTVVLIILLKIAGLPIFDSVINAFSTAGTGGFSNMNTSIAAYNNVAAEIIITIFMFLFGVNFSLYFFILGGKFKRFFKDIELRMYFLIVTASILIITVNISGIYGGIPEALRHSSFQVSSIISTTGFSTTDFNLWPGLSQFILVFLMVTGCSAGSTGGGIKIIRLVILFKAAKIELVKIFHPESVKSVSVNGKKVNNDIVSKTTSFFFIYFAVFAASVMLVSIEGKDIVTNITAVISSMSNIGPGLGVVGPAGSFASFTPFSKVVLSFCMIAGRLEFFPLLVLFTPSVWKKRLIK
ncbi:MAG: TrkH family potassium uptake protein [Oscillospiraceae bacterium]|nr:TrkH family potassium uptake protein [Oscillospiraceae bacterium]MDD4413028.1 TrkH family potassium uptake protein [Oscillospiraceae bacterium]